VTVCISWDKQKTWYY